MYRKSFFLGLKIIRFALTVIFLFGAINNLNSQQIIPTQSLQHADSIEIWKTKFETNKMCDSTLEVPFYSALSTLPSLEKTHIKIRGAKINSSLSARPRIGSLLFRRKANRRYVIRINESRKKSIPLFQYAPLSAQIGVFGHELNHIIDYNERNVFGVIGRLFAYSTIKGKERYEKEIDTETIECGLGLNLYNWALFVLKSNAPEKYKEYKKQVYLEPSEILDLIN